ncbi:MAG: FG-GAP-like repeat-containing protein [Pseudomonadales bacterium]|nr:FG-GAP-like repeat-containing protein [Pseudomonadales bacterium]
MSLEKYKGQVPEIVQAVASQSISMRFAVALLVVTVAACGGGGGGSANPEPGPVVQDPPNPPEPSVLEFTFQPANTSGLDRSWGYLVPSDSDAEFRASGIAAADYDDDGDIDLYVVGGNIAANALFQNQGDGTFVDVAPDVGLDLVHKGSGPAFADIDHDEDLDLFIGTIEGDAFYVMENRNGIYVDVTAASGIALTAPNTMSASFGDYDSDSDLDLVLGHWGSPRKPDTETLWSNNRDGTFENASVSSQIAATLIEEVDPDEVPSRTPESLTDHSFTPTFSDIDDDGDQDLLVVSDYGTSQVYINEGDGRFLLATDRDVIKDQAGTGSALGDFDNDGDIDWFVSSIHQIGESADELINYGNRLYSNEGDGTFTDVTDTAAVANGGWGWGACFADFDNDGWLDIAQVNGWNRLDEVAANNYTVDRIRLFHNQGDGTFSEIAEDAGLDHTGQGRGIACFDADRDGLQDIVIASSDDNQLVYYRNTTDNDNHYLSVRLETNGRNTDAVGARITATTAAGTQVREIRVGNNYASHNPAEAHFGLGGETEVEIRVRWPDGRRLTVSGTDVDQQVMYSQTVILPQLLIDQGTGGGAYDEGDEIVIAARVPDGDYHFSHWSSTGGGSFADPRSPETTFTMPSETVHIVANFVPGVAIEQEASLARRWNEVVLQAIRNDFARPTVHARNLFHTSAAMYDAWAAYDDTAEPWLLGRTRAGAACGFDALPVPDDITTAREEALSYAAYRIVRHRFARSPGRARIRRDADALMGAFEYDPDDESLNYAMGSAAALGNYIADCYIRFGFNDGANEENDYANLSYQPVNPPLAPEEPGNPDIVDLNRWQPLHLAVSIDQAGNPISSQPEFLSPEWGIVVPFSLGPEDLTIYERDDFEYWVYHDPGLPPAIDGALSENYKWSHSLVAIWSSHLDPADGMMVDISPASVGNVLSYPSNFEDYPDFYDTLEGGGPGAGYEFNPVTGEPYETQMVPRGDYGRVLAEFWADGPDSETPPGHWFVITNEVNDHPLLERRFEGAGDELPQLEWDVKLYFTLGGTMHDVAIAAWGIKGWYDYARPISSLRGMAELGQSSDADLPSYHLNGISLQPGYIELVEEGDPLAGEESTHVGKIKLLAWRGPDAIEDPETDVAGVDWILAENWWPYQRPSFVTPPFAGYVSGHSTYSRAAAEVLTLITGDEYFPGGMSGFEVERDEFLVFEDGPSVDMTLEWAKYYDASDQCSLSRIWGGIHPPADDIPGRLIGREIGPRAFAEARAYFDGAVD